MRRTRSEIKIGSLYKDIKNVVKIEVGKILKLESSIELIVPKTDFSKMVFVIYNLHMINQRG